jgi:hypothetical protein
MSAKVLAFPRCKRSHKELWISNIRLGGRGTVEEWSAFYDNNHMWRQHTREELIAKIRAKAEEMIEEAQIALRELRTD